MERILYRSSAAITQNATAFMIRSAVIRFGG
jgi:hypothetical protein